MAIVDNFKDIASRMKGELKVKPVPLVHPASPSNSVFMPELCLRCHGNGVNAQDPGYCTRCLGIGFEP
jgi:DnaJ-class molecular chaperone